MGVLGYIYLLINQNLMNNLLRAAVATVCLTGCGDMMQPDAPVKPPLTATQVEHKTDRCEMLFENCGDDVEICLDEWDKCVQDVREQCAGVAGSMLENPNMDSDGDGVPDIDEAVSGYTSICHAEPNPPSCGLITPFRGTTIDDCDGHGGQRQQNLLRALRDWLRKA